MTQVPEALSCFLVLLDLDHYKHLLQTRNRSAILRMEIGRFLTVAPLVCKEISASDRPHGNARTRAAGSVATLGHH